MTPIPISSSATSPSSSTTGSFTNAGFSNPSSRSGGIVDQKGGTLVNSGTSSQDGEGVFTNLTGAKIFNSGRINMFVSLLDNRGTIEIFHFGACQNLAGKLGNKTGGVLVIAGTVANFDSNTINSSA